MSTHDASIHFKVIETVEGLQKLHNVLSLAFETQSTTSENALSVISASKYICAIGALRDGEIVGGLISYELPLLKGEKELYLYDIGVLPTEQKKGIGRGLIKFLIEEAKKRGASTIFVEAEADDDGAVAFYRSLNVEELAVRHFNIPVI